jgi:hypothetical protein
LLRSEGDDVAAHGGRAVHALACDLVETVLAVASVRVFSPAES